MKKILLALLMLSMLSFKIVSMEDNSQKMVADNLNDQESFEEEPVQQERKNQEILDEIPSVWPSLPDEVKLRIIDFAGWDKHPGKSIKKLKMLERVSREFHALVYDQALMPQYIGNYVKNDRKEANTMPARRGRTALMRASEKGYAEIVKILLENHAEVNANDWDGRTALIEAAQKGNVVISKILIEHNADVNQNKKASLLMNNDGRTALIEAARRGHPEVVQILIDHTADVNEKDNNGNTALMTAAFWGHADIVSILIHNNADVTLTDNYNRTALGSARGQHAIVRLLEEQLINEV